MADSAATQGEREATEERVARIWADALRRDSVGREDRFDQIGGNSLAGIRIVTRLRKELDVRLPVSLFLDHPTVRSMTDYVLGVLAEEAQGGTPGDVTS